MRDHCRSDLRPGAVQVGDWVAVLGEQLRDLGVERGDALIEVLDVAGEVADAAARDFAFVISRGAPAVTTPMIRPRTFRWQQRGGSLAPCYR